MKKRLCVVRLKDPINISVYTDVVVWTDMTSREFEEKAKEIIKEFEREGFDDWSYMDVLETMEKKGWIEFPDFEVDFLTVVL